MSALLAKWVNQTLALDPPVTNLERDAASGELFARVMIKMGLMPDMQGVTDGTASRLRMTNFQTLAKPLATASIHLKHSEIIDICTERRGAAAKVLYQLKEWADAQAEGNRSRGGSPAVELGEDVAKWDRNAPPPDFVARCVASGMNTKQIRMAFHMRKYTEEATNQELHARDLEAREIAEMKEQLVHHVSEERKADHERREFMTQWIEDSRQKWMATQRVKAQRERDELKFELTAAAAATRRKDNTRLLATAEVIQGVDGFERNVKRLGVGPPSPRQPASIGPAGEPEAPVDFMNRMGSTFKDSFRSAESVGYMQDLRAKIRTDSVARRERETRRRKAAVDQQRAQQSVDAKRSEEAAIVRYRAENAAERKAAAQWCAQRWAKSTQAQETLKQVAAQDASINAAMEHTIQRDREVFRAARAQQDAQQAEARAARKQLLAEHAAAKQARHAALGQDIAHTIVDTVLELAEYRAAHGGMNPESRQWAAMKARFVSGEVSASRLAAAAASVAAGPGSGSERGEKFDDAIAVAADKGDVADYLQGAGGWAAAVGMVPAVTGADDLMCNASNAIATNIQQVLRGLRAASQQPATVQVPSTCLHIAVVGAPGSGKSAVAAALAAEHDLVVITPALLVERARAAYTASIELLLAVEAGEAQAPARSEAEQAAEDIVCELGLHAELLFRGADPDVEVPTRQTAMKKRKKGGKINPLPDGTNFQPATVLMDKLVNHPRFTAGMAVLVARENTAAMARHAAARSGDAVAQAGGWVLDGLPVNGAQALALEIVLGGGIATRVPPGTPFATAVAKLHSGEWNAATLAAAAVPAGTVELPVERSAFHAFGIMTCDAALAEERVAHTHLDGAGCAVQEGGLAYPLVERRTAWSSASPAVVSWYTSCGIGKEVDSTEASVARCFGAIDETMDNLLAAGSRSPTSTSSAFSSPRAGDGFSFDAVFNVQQQLARLLLLGRRGFALDAAAVSQLVDEWQTAEDEYCSALRLSMRAIRCDLRTASRRFTYLRRAFLALLRRPIDPAADGTSLVKDLERKVAVAVSNPKNHGQLPALSHAAEELGDALWAKVELMLDDANEVLDSLTNDSWPSRRQWVISVALEGLICAELLHCQQELTLLQRYFEMVTPPGVRDSAPTTWQRTAQDHLPTAPTSAIEEGVQALPVMVSVLSTAYAELHTLLASVTPVSMEHDASIGLAVAVAWKRVTAVAMAGASLHQDTLQTAQALWEELDAYTSMRTKSLNDHIGGLIANIKTAITSKTLPRGGHGFALDGTDSMGSPWGYADTAELYSMTVLRNTVDTAFESVSSLPEPPLQDAAGFRRILRTMCAAITGEEVYAGTLPVFSVTPSFRLTGHRLLSVAETLKRRATKSAVRGQPAYLLPINKVVEEIVRLAADGVLPSGWSRLSAATLNFVASQVSLSAGTRGSTRAMPIHVQRGAVAAGGAGGAASSNLQLDVRMIVLCLAYGLLGSIPAAKDVVAMYRAFLGADVGKTGFVSGGFGSIPLWFQRPKAVVSMKADVAADTACIADALWAAWADDGKLDYKAFLFDLCADPRSGAQGEETLQSLHRHGTVPAAARAPGLYKAFVLQALLEERLSGCPGDRAEANPPMAAENVCVSSDGFASLLHREAARGLAVRVFFRQ